MLLFGQRICLRRGEEHLVEDIQSVHGDGQTRVKNNRRGLRVVANVERRGFGRIWLDQTTADEDQPPDGGGDLAQVVTQERGGCAIAYSSASASSMPVSTSIST